MLLSYAKLDVIECPVESGLLCVIRGVCSVVCDPWSVLCCVCPVESGLLCVILVLCSVESGLLCVIRGVCSVVSGLLCVMRGVCCDVCSVECHLGHCNAQSVQRFSCALLSVGTSWIIFQCNFVCQCFGFCVLRFLQNLTSDLILCQCSHSLLKFE